MSFTVWTYRGADYFIAKDGDSYVVATKRDLQSMRLVRDRTLRLWRSEDPEQAQERLARYVKSRKNWYDYKALKRNILPPVFNNRRYDVYDREDIKVIRETEEKEKEN